MRNLEIRKGKERSIQRQHPWVFSGAIVNSDGVIDGELVKLIDSKGNYIATGHFQNATVMVRVLTFENEEIDQHFWNKRIASALQRRKTAGLVDNKRTNAYRLVHGEGDGLPGLIIDFYASHAVIQAHSIGMLKSLNYISKALLFAFNEKLDVIYAKHDINLARKVGIESKGEFLHGNSEGIVHILENDCKFEVDYINGQKTGFFLDQRDNRNIISNYTSGKKVLNTYCYSGGFSIYALKAGAEKVVSLDSSRHAIQLTENNIKINNIADNVHESVTEDAIEYLKDLKEDFDIIVLDPPAFAKHKNTRHKAIQAYKRINTMAMKQIKSGGILFTFSCSQIMEREIFRNTVTAAAIEAGRKVQILHQLTQPADHPVNVFHPEGEYLKGLVLYIE